MSDLCNFPSQLNCCDAELLPRDSPTPTNFFELFCMCEKRKNYIFKIHDGQKCPLGKTTEQNKKTQDNLLWLKLLLSSQGEKSLWTRGLKTTETIAPS